ncbi:MAG: iron ABC transporter permease [Bacteroidales bacterium]|nr:iron ABC transporter permease [Bacteroidales bacterium]
MPRNRNILLFTLAVLAILVLMVVDMATGSTHIAPREILNALLGRGDASIITIVREIRLSRALTALMSGAALSAAGLMMQTLFRNPLAGPHVLGITSGASLGVAVFILGIPAFGISSVLFKSLGMVGAAWIGSAAIIMLLVALSSRIKDIMVILILGIMLGSGIDAIIQILQYFGSEASLKSYVLWTMGSLGDVTGRELAILAIAVVGGLALSIPSVKPLNLLLLGEDYAKSMGTDVRRARILIFVSTTILAGSITAFCGPIGFIGLAVPHISRMLWKTADHRVLLPASVLTGMATMLLCDIASKSLALPINTVTALVGIPVLIMVVFKNQFVK